LDAALLVLFEVVVLLAAVVSGLTGFGFALVLGPILMLIIDPKVVVPIVAVLSVVLNLFLFYSARRWAEPAKMAPLMAAGVAGMAAGILLLVFLNVTALKFLVSVVIISFSLAIMGNFRLQASDSRLDTLIVGLVSGFLGGSTSMSGPPVVLFFSNQGYGKMAFRANLMAYFLVLYSVTLPGYWVGGLLTGEVFSFSALAIPALLAGSVLGARLVPRVPEVRFRYLTLLLVLLTGLVTLATSLHLF